MQSTPFSMKFLSVFATACSVTFAFLLLREHRLREELEEKLRRSTELATSQLEAVKKGSKTVETPVREETLLHVTTSGISEGDKAEELGFSAGEQQVSEKISAPPQKTDLKEAQKDREYRVRARISAIEKFVPLSDEQRERLIAKFSTEIDQEEDEQKSPAESEKEGEGEPSLPSTDEVKTSTESLEDIIGKDNAEFYRSQMNQAFEHAQNEEREKDVLLMSRKLSLAPEQENQLRQAMLTVEKKIGEQRKSTANAQAGEKKLTMQQRLQRMVEENKLRQQLLAEQIRTIFTDEQYQMYLQEQAASPQGDFEVFHGAENGGE